MAKFSEEASMLNFRGKLLVILVLSAVALTSCVVGQKINYVSANPEASFKGSMAVAVAVWDNRPYVLNGEKPSTYVGTFRGGFGNPFNVNTESGQPLAQDWT